MRRVEPPRLQRAEVIVVENGLAFCKPRPAGGSDVVTETRRLGEPCAVVVDRPAEVIADHEQARRFRPRRSAAGTYARRMARTGAEAIRRNTAVTRATLRDTGLQRRQRAARESPDGVRPARRADGRARPAALRGSRSRARPRRRAPDGRRYADMRPAVRRQAPRATRWSTDRRGSVRGRRRAHEAARPALRTERADDADVLEARLRVPANVTSNESKSRFVSSQPRMSAPLRGLSDQLVAMTRSRGVLLAARRAGWKIAGSTAFGITTGSRSASPSSRCLSRLYADWRIVASASSWLISRSVDRCRRRSRDRYRPARRPDGPCARRRGRTASASRSRS